MTPAKYARTPPPGPTVSESDLAAQPEVLWRIHRTAGAHPAEWDALRDYGPLPGMRWDPHPDPLGDHPGSGVLYAATDPRICLAETFQGRAVHVRIDAPALTAWEPTRPLRLLDLTGDWPLRHEARASPHAAPRKVCRRWSRAIRGLTAPDSAPLDGLLAASTMRGHGSAVVLFDPARDAFPDAPTFSRPLADPVVLAQVVEPFAQATGWPLLA